MADLTAEAGFAAPFTGTLLSRRSTAGVALFASAALAICLVVAMTAVSIGMAHARTLGTIIGGDGAPSAAIGAFIRL